MLPLKDFFRLIDEHFGVRIQIMTLEHALESAATQFRIVQKRLLSKYKHKSPSDLLNLDLLLKESFMRINTLAEKMEKCKTQLTVACAKLSCAIHLLLLLLRFKFGLDSKNAFLTEAFLSPDVADDTESQGWEERTKASILYVLKNILVKERPKGVAPPQTMNLMADTSKLKRHIQLFCDRLSKGLRLYKPSSRNLKKNRRRVPKPEDTKGRPSDQKN
ncbi:hypothetical protein AAMO2058_000588100 [Amorphochlora amoebiformis]